MSKFGVLRDIHRELKNSGEVQSIFSDEKKLLKSEDGKEIKVFELLENKQDIQDIIEQNKMQIYSVIFTESEEINKKLRRPLRKFLKDYLSALTIEEEQEILAKIDYYLELYEIYNLEVENKLTKEILASKDSFSKIEILLELLLSSTILPKYENQKQFNEEMMKFIPRLEQSINEFLLERKVVIFAPIVARRLLGYMRDQEAYNLTGSKVVEGGIIKQIAYNFSLGENARINETNEFDFSFLINDKELLSRETFISYLENVLHLKHSPDGKYYIYESDNLFNYSIYVLEEMYNRDAQTFEDFKENGLNIDEEGFIYNGFEVKIYAETKKNLPTEEVFLNMCNSLPAITERFINELYRTYGISKGEKVGIPKKSFVFNVMDRLNFYYPGESGFSIPTDQGEEIMKNITSGTNIEIPFETLDLKTRERKELLLDDDLDLTINILADQINNPGKYKELGIKNFDSGIIFYGPGGVGKTELCYEIGYKTMDNTDFSILDLSIVFNQYLGNSEKYVKKIFSELRLRYETTKKIQILLIDEIDGLMSNEQSSTYASIRSVLLTELSSGKNQGIVFVGTTNHIDKLAGPISRRFSKKVGVDLPDEKTRKKLIEFYISKYKIGLFDGINIDMLVSKTKGKSHDFINKLLNNTVIKLGYLGKEKCEIKDILSNFKMTDDEIGAQTEENIMGFKV